MAPKQRLNLLSTSRVVVPPGSDGFAGKAKQKDFSAGAWKIIDSIHGSDVARNADAWAHDVETNNIQRHETPVIRELRKAGFAETERLKMACKKPNGLKECFYEDGGNSIDMSSRGKAPDTEAAGPIRGKKVSDMTWAEKVSCAFFCSEK